MYVRRSLLNSANFHQFHRRCFRYLNNNDGRNPRGSFNFEESGEAAYESVAYTFVWRIMHVWVVLRFRPRATCAKAERELVCGGASGCVPLTSRNPFSCIICQTKPFSHFSFQWYPPSSPPPPHTHNCHHDLGPTLSPRSRTCKFNKHWFREFHEHSITAIWRPKFSVP